jgi:hypothetical protein
VEASACSKASNTAGWRSGAIPIPVSATSIALGVPAASASTRTVTAPRSVNLSAFPTRLMSTCLRRRGVRLARRERGGQLGPQRHALAVRLQLERRERLGHELVEPHRRQLRLELPGLDLREVEDAVDEGEEVVTLRHHAVQVAELARREPRLRVWRRIFEKPMIAVRGVRSSWFTRVRNSPFARFAASAASRARRSSTSAAFVSVMSRSAAATPPSKGTTCRWSQPARVRWSAAWYSPSYATPLSATRRCTSNSPLLRASGRSSHSSRPTTASRGSP